MKKLLGVALLGVTAAAPMAAQQQLCGASDPNAYPVCVLANFTLTNSGSTLNMFVFNGSTATSAGFASAITGVVVNLPGATVDNSLAVFFVNNGGAPTNITSAWSNAGTNWGSSGISADLVGVSTGNQGVSTCTGPASGGVGTNTERWETCQRPGGTAFGAGWDYVLFSWGLTAPMTQQELSQIAWGFRGQTVGPNGDSIKCVTDDQAFLDGKEKDPVGKYECTLGTYDNPDDPGEIVPEPATMTLLATGLAGMAVAQRRRRKDRNTPSVS